MERLSPYKIVVTGATGLLGRELSRYLEFIPITRENLDIRDKAQVEKVFKKIKPDVTVHCAAISTALQAEKDPRVSFDTNVIGTLNVAEQSKHIIYISTDYIFDGTKGNYSEHDMPNPLSLIGKHKLMGEIAARSAPRFTIIRTSFKEIPYRHAVVPYDMFSSADYVPIIAYHIAKAIKHSSELPDILNIGTERKRLIELATQTRNVKAINRSDIDIPLPRDCSLDTSLYDSLCSNWD